MCNTRELESSHHHTAADNFRAASAVHGAGLNQRMRPSHRISFSRLNANLCFFRPAPRLPESEQTLVLPSFSTPRVYSSNFDLPFPQVGAPAAFDDICGLAKRRQLRPRGDGGAPLPPMAGMPGAAVAARPAVRGGGGLCGGQHGGGKVRDGADAGAVLRAAGGSAGGFYRRRDALDGGPQVRTAWQGAP